jgi:chromate transporter
MPPLDPATPGPRSLSDLFLTFNRMALQGFGGVLAIAQHELVERKRWLTREQFVEMLAVSQVLPGPNVVNLSLMIGDRHFGLRGAFAALAGMLLVPLLIVLALAALYAEFARVPMVAGALRGMGAVAAGLVIATGLKLLTTLSRNPLGVRLGAAFAALMFAAIALLHWPLAWTLLGLGSVACALAWRRL